MIARREGLALALVILAAVALFAPSLGYALTLDDYGTIVEHPGVQSARFSFSDLFLRDWWGHRFGAPEGVPTYRPLVTLTFWIDQRVGRGAPAVFHATNLALYALLLFSAHRLLRTWAGEALSARARIVALALFGALAIHADVVPSVTGRSELMTMLFAVLALRFALLDDTRAALAGFSLASAAALLCKESALTFVLVVPVLAARWGVSRRRSAALAALACASVAALLIIRVRLGLPLRATYIGVEEANVLYLRSGFLSRLPGAMDVLARYGLHTAAGVDLCPDYSYAAVIPAARWLELAPIVGALLALCASALALATLRRWPRICDALVAFAASYAVVSHVLTPGSAVIADRLFFFPSFWVVVAAALLASRASPRLKQLAVPVASAFILTQAVLTLFAARMWRDPRTLAVHTVSTCPHNGHGRWMRAHAAYVEHDVENTAWQLIAQAALYNSFPARIPDSTLSADWEALPVPRRLVRLREALPADRYRDAILRGAFFARSGGYREAESFIHRWVLPTVGAAPGQAPP